MSQFLSKNTAGRIQRISTNADFALIDVIRAQTLNPSTSIPYQKISQELTQEEYDAIVAMFNEPKALFTFLINPAL